MRTFRNIALMFAVNIGIIITLSIVLSLLGVEPYMQSYGLNYESLAIFCLVWGMGASFISLLMSKTIVKWTMGVKVLKENEITSPELRKLHLMLQRLSLQAGLPKTPELGVYQSPEMNAFATGPSKSRSLVAFSTGLLEKMTDEEIEGVAAHEIAHIANGDMITMTLLQGVVNALIMFIARIIAFAVSSRFERDSRYWIQFVTVIVAQLILGVFGVMITSWFSRKREFRADQGGARYAGRSKMIAALQALNNRHQIADDRAPQMAALKISSSKKGGFLSLLSTHPPLEERIEALKSARI
ncbi:protease HtpX [bacterium]|nr:protease HtpX [bacterium]